MSENIFEIWKARVKTPIVSGALVASGIGNPALLDQGLIGVFASVKCPARLILAAHNAAHEITAQGKPVIGGFQSPTEKEMLEVLLRGSSTIVICPARGLEGMRIPKAWQQKIKKGQLLIISPFPPYIRRPSYETVMERNQLVANLASELLVIHADPGGKVESLVNEVASNGKKVQRL